MRTKAKHPAGRSKTRAWDVTPRLKPWMFANDVKDSFIPAIVDYDVRADVSIFSEPNSFHRAMSRVLVVAQCFAILPVEGVTGPDAQSLRFRWCSFRVFYSIFCLLGTMFLVSIFAIDLYDNSAYLGIGAVVVYECVNTLCILLFLHLATKWPELMKQVQAVERSMNTNYGYPKNLTKYFRVVASVILASALLEHILSNFKSLKLSIDCADGSREWFEIYINHNFPVVFTSFMSFSPVVALIMRHTSTINVFAWNFMDIFIILVSKMLSSRFRQINDRVKHVRNQVMAEDFWRQIRKDYNNLSVLVKRIDGNINKIVLLSFANNIFFICVQLLKSTMKYLDPETFANFFVSFMHLLLRSMAMCLFAASIHDESKAPKVALFAVPSESYSQEVKRFIVQVTTNEVALSGLNFFFITKTLLLTLAGTIVTYEIVLLQISSGTDDNDDVANNATYPINPFCPNHTSR